MRKYIQTMSDKLELLQADTNDIIEQLKEDDEITKSYDKVLNHNLSCKK